MKRARQPESTALFSVLTLIVLGVMGLSVALNYLLEWTPSTQAQPQGGTNNPYMKVVLLSPQPGSTVSNTITLSAAVIFSPLDFRVTQQSVQVASLGRLAGMPQPRALRATWDPCQIPSGSSNAVVTVYRSTSLGTVWTPFKPSAITPAARTNTTLTVIPGTYRFYATLSAQPYGESNPSNCVTNHVLQ